MIGQTLGHYSILKKLGEGGMGAVYLAEDSRLNRKIALKVLPKEMAEQPERIRRFEREAKLVANLNHPNIVTLFSVEEVEGTRFITMELVEGKTLGELMTEDGMAAADFVKLAIPMVEALSAAHEKGIAHRDLKPANIMVTNDQRVKILDFGVAKLQDGADELLGPGMQTVTQEGSFVGTVAYMAPEQARGSAPDLRADLFSLGIVLYETATGRRPFEGETSIEVVSNILREEPPPVSEVKVDLPHDLGRIIGRCLEKDPENRYQNATALLKDLRELRRAIDLGTARLGPGAVGDSTVVLSGPVEVPEPPAPAAPGKRPLLLWGGVAAAAVVIAGAVYLGTRPGEPPPTPATTPEATAGAPAPAEPAAPTLQDTLVAVRPFETIGGIDHEGFGLGLTEDIATRLTSLGELQLVARGRVEALPNSATPSEIGAELGAGHVLAGSVRWGGTLESGRRVRVNLRLVRSADEIQVWSELFDRQVDDALAVQSDIARAVARAVGIALLGSIPPEIAAAWDEEESFEMESEPEPTLVQPIPQISVATPGPVEREAVPRTVVEAPPTLDEPTRPAAGGTSSAGSDSAGAAAAPAPRRTPAPAVTGEGTLVVEFSSEAPDGEIKIFADDSLIFEREFTGRRKGLFGKAKRSFKTSAPDHTFLSERTVSRSLSEVQVVIEMEGLPLNRQTIRLDYGKTHKYKLKIDVDRDGGVTIQPLFARPR